jgi:predicted nucleic acid-binding protein
MLVVDASCLFEVVADTPRSSEIASRLADDVDQLAPHVIDVEVMGVIRAQHLRGQLDNTAAGQAVSDLQD